MRTLIKNIIDTCTARVVYTMAIACTRFLRRVYTTAVVCALLVAVCVTQVILFGQGTPAYAAFNKEINYQGKLTNSSNVAVPDGTYHMQFKLYTVATGGVSIWDEDRSTATGDRITVTNGLFSVMLGSSTPLTSVNFDQTLYLGVEIGGSSGSPSWDGEMTPRKKLGAVPAAFVADTVDGLSSEQFLRADATNATNTASTFVTITQNGAGDIANFIGPSSASVLAIRSGGNVGIGTSSPYAKLSVAGQVVGQYFTATGTTASVLPYASSTALSVSGIGYFGTASTTALTVSGISGCSGSNALTTNSSGVVACGALSTGAAYPFTPTENFGVNTSATSTALWARAGLYASSTSQFAAANFYGSVGIGTSSPWAQLSINPDGITGPAFAIGSSTKTLFAVAQSGAGVSINRALPTVGELEVFGNTSFGTVLLGRNDNSITVGEQLGMIGFDGLDSLSSGGSAYAADIRAFASESHTSAAKGAYMTFNVKPNGSTQGGGSVEVVRITEFTNVGVGTTSPFAKFQIATSTANVGFKPQLVLTDTGGGTDAKHWYLSSESSSFRIGSTSDAYATSTYFTVANGGNVGIGTTSPYAKLSVVGQAVAAYFTATTSTASTFPYASTTALTVSGTGYFGTASTTALTVSGISGCSGSNALTTNSSGVVACGALSTGAAYPFTPNTNFNTAVSATSSIIWAQSGLHASSTSRFVDVQTYGVLYAGITGSLPATGIVAQGSGVAMTGAAGGYFVEIADDDDNRAVHATDAGGNTGSLADTASGSGVLGSGLTYGVSGSNSSPTGAGVNALQYDASGYALYASGGKNYFEGNVGIGTTSPYAKLSVVGETVSTYFTATGTRASTFPYASSTALTVSGSLYVGSLNGPLQANNGLVSATTSIGVLYGGTGLTSAPSYGQLLLGNSSSGYTLTATSSLGLLGSSSIGVGAIGQLPYYAAASNVLTATSGIFINTSGNVGIGTTDPTAKLEINGNLYFSAGANRTIGFDSAAGVDLSILGANSTTVPGGDIFIGAGSDDEAQAAGGNVFIYPGSGNFNGAVVLGHNGSSSFGNVGVGSSSPATKFAVQGTGYISGSLFVGGAITSTSSTASTFPYASTTALTVSGTGYFGTASTTALTVSGISGCSGSNALTTNSSGVVACGAITGGGGTYPFTPTTNFNTGVSATSTPIWAQNGLYASSTSYFPLGTWNSSGFLGVGTTSPWGQLSINPNQIGTAPSFVIGSSTQTHFIVTNQGYVGIGTTTPEYPLHVVAATSTDSAPLNVLTVEAVRTGGTPSAGFGPAILFKDAAVTSDFMAKIASLYEDAAGGAKLGSLAFYTPVNGGPESNLLERMRINHEGWVGIGSTSPSALLTVSANSGTIYSWSQNLFLVSSSTGSGATSTHFVVTAGGNSGFGTTSPWGQLSVNPNLIGTGPAFVVGSSTRTNFIITNTGSVGVGTSSPAGTFAAQGSATGFDGVATAGNIFLTGGSGVLSGVGVSGSVGGAVVLTGGKGGDNNVDTDFNGGDVLITGGATSGATGGFGGGTGGNVVINPGVGTTTGNILLATTNLGNVGIGTTSPYAKLSVVGQVLGAYFTATTSTASVFPYASTTALTVSGTGYFGTASTTALTVSGISGCSGSNALTTNSSGVVACGAITGGGGTYPFTPTTNFNTGVSATSTPIWAQLGLYASSTSQFDYATITAFTVTGNAYFPGNGIWNSSGNVGVGTTSVDGLLHVSSGVSGQNSPNSGADDLILEGGTSGAGMTILVPSARTASIFFGNESSATAGGIRYFNGSNTFQISANNSIAQTIVAGGNTGIASSSPWARLSVGSANSTAPQFVIASSSTGIATTTQFIVDILGNVGIGTTSPWAQLSVNPNNVFGPSFAIGSSTDTQFLVSNGGSVMIGTTTSLASDKLSVNGGNLFIRNLTPQFVLVDTASTDNNFGMRAQNGIASFFRANNDSSLSNYLMAFDLANTRVGIGTTSPYAKLSVVGEVVSAFFSATSTAATSTFAHGLDVGGGMSNNGFIKLGSSNANYYTHIVNKVDSNESFWIEVANKGRILGYKNLSIGGESSAGAFLQGYYGIAFTTFGATSPAAADVRMVITKIGNVGIATTSPFARLAVTGSSTDSTNAFLVSDSNNVPKFTVQNDGIVKIAGTASTTNLTISGISGCSGSSALTTDSSGVVACGGIVGGGGAFPFTPTTHFGVNTSATSTPIWAQAGLYASSTSYFERAQIGSGALFNSAMFHIGSSTNSFLQANIQNYSNGGSASSDWVATNDIGSDTTYYVDLGINSSGYNDAAYTITGANDAYLYAQSNALSIGTATSSTLGVIKFHTGGTLAANERMRITSTGLVGIGSTSPYAQLSVVGGGNNGVFPSFVVATTSSWVNGAQQPLFFVTATTSGKLNYSRVAIGTTSPWGTSGLRDQFTVDGRIYSTWRYLSCDIGGSGGGVWSSDAAGACGDFSFDFDTDGTSALTRTAYPPAIELRAGSTNATVGDGSALRTTVMAGSATSSPIFEAWVQPSRPAAATSSPLYIVGMLNNAFGADLGTTMPTQGAYFIATSTPNWRIVTRSANNVETITDSGLATSTAEFRKMRIELTTTEATFLVNGNVVAVHQTNIPTATLQPIAQVGIFANGGTSASTLSLFVSLMRFWMDDPPGTLAGSALAGLSGEEGGVASLNQEDVDTYNSISAAAITAPYLVGEVSEFIEGSVVAFHEEDKARVRLSSRAYDTNTFGVVGMTSVQNLGETNKNTINVALSGRVPVLVSLENGNIKPGDYLTSSSIPGVAMKATASGPVLGRAIQVYDENTRLYSDTVMMTVEPGYYTGSALVQNAQGNVGVGTTSDVFKLTVSGDVGAYGFSASGKASMMNEISAIPDEDLNTYLEKIKNTTISTYRYKDEAASAPLRLGIVADEAPSEILSVSGEDVDVYKLAVFTLGGVKALEHKFNALDLRVTALENQIFGFASSTATSTATTTVIADGSFFDQMISHLETFGVRIAQGLAEFKNVIVETLIVGSPEKPSGITLYDEVTGEPYCLTIANGKMKNRPGECGAEEVETVDTSDETTDGAEGETQEQTEGGQDGEQEDQTDETGGAGDETEGDAGGENSGEKGDTSGGDSSGGDSGDAGGDTGGGETGGDSGEAGA